MQKKPSKQELEATNLFLPEVEVYITDPLDPANDKVLYLDEYLRAQVLRELIDEHIDWIEERGYQIWQKDQNERSKP